MFAGCTELILDDHIVAFDYLSGQIVEPSSPGAN